MIPFRGPGTAATLRAVGARVLWACPTVVVEDTPSLVALYLRAGTALKNSPRRIVPADLLSPEGIQVGDGVWQHTDVLMLIVPEDSFSVYLMWEAGTRNLLCWYINLQEPVRRTTIGYDTMDHILDIVVSPDMTKWYWKDEDEFAEAGRIGYYSPEQMQAIRSEGKRALRLLSSERRPFYESWMNLSPDPSWKLPALSPLWDCLGKTVHTAA